jgi:hypothetical protein
MEGFCLHHSGEEQEGQAGFGIRIRMSLATDEGEQSRYSKMPNRHREREIHMFEHEPSDRKNREACVDGLS